MFYRRDTHVAELQMGTPASRLEEACDFDHFDVSRLPFITMLGKYSFNVMPTKNGFEITYLFLIYYNSINIRIGSLST